MIKHNYKMHLSMLVVLTALCIYKPIACGEPDYYDHVNESCTIYPPSPEPQIASMEWPPEPVANLFAIDPAAPQLSEEESMAIQDAKKSHLCLTCGKSFEHGRYLRIHERTHTGEKPYTCPICQKSFSQAGNFRQHERRHTGEKPHRCIQCNACFTDAKSLIRHARTHTDERPHACSICQKSFARASDLIRHARTHTGVKPYQCSTCGKCFARKNTLQKHQQTKAACVAAEPTVEEQS